MEREPAGSFPPRNRSLPHLARFGHNSGPNPLYSSPMDPMLKIPKNRKRVPLWRLCLLMGMTALIFLLVANNYSAAFSMLQPYLAR
jgi:hypothetical protein